MARFAEYMFHIHCRLLSSIDVHQRDDQLVDDLKCSSEVKLLKSTKLNTKQITVIKQTNSKFLYTPSEYFLNKNSMTKFFQLLKKRSIKSLKNVFLTLFGFINDYFSMMKMDLLKHKLAKDFNNYFVRHIYQLDTNRNHSEIIFLLEMSVELTKFSIKIFIEEKKIKNYVLVPRKN
ncbi:hypothetical protein BpHYR1_015984 [Brachionus plicatilis]|uniref:Uncharacterized protein n=1 Tax=Brachionus plicatilis TaxID=10195 RepID=A0A3M7PBY5_BRAPC|nr:hypothetical protein BpHYR1_015984 [Brachionus plicatilis]